MELHFQDEDNLNGNGFDAVARDRDGNALAMIFEEDRRWHAYIPEPGEFADTTFDTREAAIAWAREQFAQVPE